MSDSVDKKYKLEIMMRSLFEFKDYKRYLSHKLKSLGRGSQKNLAQAIRCQPGYVVQVLKGNNHFSLEQAEDINNFLNHHELESDYFFTLVELARAGTPRLRKRFQGKLKLIKQEASQLKNRLKDVKLIDPFSMQRFYSSWTYMAVHACFTLPKINSKKIAKLLKLENEEVENIIDFLLKNDLLIAGPEGHQLSERSFHLAGDDPLVLSHHHNWRMKALMSMQKLRPTQTHYSSVISLSRANRERLKGLTIDYLNEVRETLTQEQEPELLMCLNLDLFDLI